MGLSKLAKGWRKGAVKGNAEDQNQLAHCYAEGTEGVKRDKVAAAAWLGKAAEQEHAAPQVSLGVCYARGEGVGQNLELAVTFYRKAADAGHAISQGLLGACYANGTGVEQNDAMALAWWEKATTGGNATSQHRLGLCYMHGERGLPKNARRARSFLKAAAEQGYTKAIEDLKLLNTCESCGAPDANRTCGGCRPTKGFNMVRYCTPECQKKDWKFHKLDCGGLKVCECRNCRVCEQGESSTSAAPG
jgi:TPR repeat protein